MATRTRGVRRDPVYDYEPPVWTPDPPADDPYRPVPRTDPPRDRTITFAGVTGNVDLFYGKQELGGQIMFHHYDVREDSLWLVVVLGWGETDGEWGTLLLDDRTVSSWSSTYAAYWFYRGAPGQTYNTNLASVLPSWNENLAGLTYGIVKLRLFARHWQGKIPAMRWQVRGRRCLDPRSLASPIAYSENLWVQEYDYRRAAAGQAMPESAMATTDWADAADVADEVMGDGSKRFEYHAIITDDASVEDWLAQFAIAGNGHTWWDGEQFRLFLDRPATPSKTVGDSDLLKQGYSFTRRHDPFDKPNQVLIYFTDEADGFNKNAPPVDVKTAALLAGTEDPITVTHKLPDIRKRSQAQRLGIFLLNDLVFDGLLTRTERATAVDREPGDVVTVVQAAKGLNQAFRAIPVTRNPDHSYDIEYLEYNAARYSDTTVADGSTIKSAYGNPRDQPPYPAGVAVDDKDAPEDVQTTTWIEIPMRSDTLYGAGNWSTVNCGAVTAANINDGDYGTKALDFNVAGESQVILDAGLGNAPEFREVVVAVTATGGALAACGVDWSDDGSIWTTSGGVSFVWGSRLVDIDGTEFSPARRVGAIAAAGGHRYWRLRQTDTGAKTVDIAEVQFYEFLGDWPWSDAVLLTAEGSNPIGATVASAKPDVLRIDTTSLGSFTYNGINDSGHTATFSSQLHARSKTGALSLGVASGGGVAVMANTSGYAPDYIAKGETAPSLSNGANHNVAISSIASVIRCAGPTAAFSITGFVAKDGANNSGEGGRLYTCWNDTADVLTLAHENAGSTAANRLSTETGADEDIAAGGRFWIFYEESSSRWRVIPAPSGAAGNSRSILYHTFTWDPPSIFANNQATTDVTVTGAAIGDVVSANAALSSNALVLSAFVVSANTVRVVLRNTSSSSYNETSKDFYVSVIQAATSASGREILYHTFNWDPPSLTAGAASGTSITVTGAEIGDVVVVNRVVASFYGVREFGYVTAADTVAIFVHNTDTSTRDVAATDFYVAVVKQD